MCTILESNRVGASSLPELPEISSMFACYRQTKKIKLMSKFTPSSWQRETPAVLVFGIQGSAIS